MKKYIFSASLGVTIGTFMALLFSGLFAEGQFVPINPYSTMGMIYQDKLTELSTMGLSVFIWAAIGILFRAADVLFYKPWSLLKMTVTHFVVTVTGFTILGILAGWFPLNLGNLIFFWLIYIFIYAVIYWFNYREMKRTVDQINRAVG